MYSEYKLQVYLRCSWRKISVAVESKAKQISNHKYIKFIVV